MSRWQKLSIGLAAALLAGWISHGPLGRGTAYVDRLEADAKAVVGRVKTENRLPAAISVRMGREPLSRVAILSGTNDSFLRCGTASFIRGNRDCSMPRRESDVYGINDWVRTVPGISGLRWEPSGRVVPLIAETLGLAALAWAIGLGLGWLLFRPRRKREGYL